jgi:hypothetical protein
MIYVVTTVNPSSYFAKEECNLTFVNGQNSITYNETRIGSWKYTHKGTGRSPLISELWTYSDNSWTEQNSRTVSDGSTSSLYTWSTTGVYSVVQNSVKTLTHTVYKPSIASSATYKLTVGTLNGTSLSTTTSEGKSRGYVDSSLGLSESYTFEEISVGVDDEMVETIASTMTVICGIKPAPYEAANGFGIFCFKAKKQKNISVLADWDSSALAGTNSKFTWETANLFELMDAVAGNQYSISRGFSTSPATIINSVFATSTAKTTSSVVDIKNNSAGIPVTATKEITVRDMTSIKAVAITESWSCTDCTYINPDFSAGVYKKLNTKQINDANFGQAFQRNEWHWAYREPLIKRAIGSNASGNCNFPVFPVEAIKNFENACVAACEAIELYGIALGTESSNTDGFASNLSYPSFTATSIKWVESVAGVSVVYSYKKTESSGTTEISLGRGFSTTKNTATSGSGSFIASKSGSAAKISTYKEVEAGDAGSPAFVEVFPFCYAYYFDNVGYPGLIPGKKVTWTKSVGRSGPVVVGADVHSVSTFEVDYGASNNSSQTIGGKLPLPVMTLLSAIPANYYYYDHLGANQHNIMHWYAFRLPEIDPKFPGLTVSFGT